MITTYKDDYYGRLVVVFDNFWHTKFITVSGAMNTPVAVYRTLFSAKYTYPF